MSTTAARISQVQLVMIPSGDQDRSIAFYESLGFEKRLDIPFGGRHRWVEVYPRGGTTGIALVSPRPGDPTGVQTGIILNTDDIDATHAQLQSRGVDVDAEVARVGAPAEIRIGAAELVGHVLHDSSFGLISSFRRPRPLAGRSRLMAHGPAAGLALVEELDRSGRLSAYHLLYATPRRPTPPPRTTRQGRPVLPRCARARQHRQRTQLPPPPAR